jgi:hypothetical protein
MVHLIFKSLDESELVMLTSKMSDSQLQKVQATINIHIKEKELGVFDKMIELAVMGLFLDSKPKLPHVVSSFLSTLTASSAYQLAKESKVFGGLMLHYLPQNLIGELLNILDDQTMSDCLRYANQFDKSYILKHGAEIEKLISQKTADQVDDKISGVLSVLPSFLESASLDKEKFILKEVRDFCSRKEFCQIILETLPLSFLLSYSEETARKIFDGVSFKSKVKMAVIVPEYVAWSLPDWVGPKNSKAREIFDMEVVNFKNDPRLMEQALTLKENLWKEFFQKVRTIIKSKSENKDSLQSALHQWVETQFYTQIHQTSSPGSSEAA